MKSSSHSPLFRQIAVASLVLAGFAVQNATAAFVWDLRATSKNGIAVTAAESKAVNVQVGDVLQFDMFAMVTGLNTNLPTPDEGFQSGLGKVIATGNGVAGNMSAPVLSSNFTAGSVGTVQDLNSDGFADIGSTAATTSSTVGNMFPRFTTNGAFDLTGTPINAGLGKEFNLFHFTYTVVNAAAGTASIQFTQQLTTVINSATFQVDGVTVTSKNIGLPVGTNATTNGAPVILSVVVPEPSAFGMLALGALGLVGFRRIGLRRTA